MQRYTTFEAACADQLQVQFVTHAIEYLSATCYNHRVYHKLVLIYQAGFRKLCYNTSAAQDGQILSGCLFHLLYSRYNIVFQYAAIVPLCFSQCSRKNNFLNPVDTFSNHRRYFSFASGRDEAISRNECQPKSGRSTKKQNVRLFDKSGHF